MDEVTSETKETGTVVLNTEPEVISTEKVVPSREDLKKKGWTAAEMDSAEKRGMIKKKEVPDAKAEPKAETVTQPTQEEKRKTDEALAIDRRGGGSWIDYEMTPEQEKVFLATFPPGTPQNGTHLRMKSERRARQQAENRAKELEARIKELEAKATVKPEPVLDSDGNEIDPEDKPLTVKEWRALHAKQQEDIQRQQDEVRQRGQLVAESISTQEEYAKSIYPDYDDTVKLAIEIRKNPELLDSPWKRQQAELLWEKISEAAQQADKLGIDDLNSALLGYEMGKLHPSYGKAPTNGHRAETHNDGKKDPKNANGSVTPEQMERIAQNTQRRVSSASIPGGGGSRTISVEDVTIKELNQMTSAQRASFKSKHPARYTELLRG